MSVNRSVGLFALELKAVDHRHCLVGCQNIVCGGTVHRTVNLCNCGVWMLEHKIEIQERLKFRTETYLKKKMKYTSLYNIEGSETVDAELYIIQ